MLSDIVEYLGSLLVVWDYAPEAVNLVFTALFGVFFIIAVINVFLGWANK